jgi:hypothetical protein
VAILCALGWNSVRLTQVRLYFQLGLPTALLAYAVVSAFWFAEQIIEQSHDRVAYGIAASVSLAVVSLLVFGILTILNSKNTRLASNGFYALVLVEVLLLSFRIHPEAAPKDTEESAEGFLRSTSSDYRLLSSPALPPNLATEFSLYDLGVLDPLLPSRYVSIMSAISDQPIRSRLSTEEIINLEHPFLDLASVRTIFHRKDIRNLLLRSAPSGENLPMMTVPGFDYETKSTPSGFSRSYNLWIPVENPELVLFITSTKEVSLRLTADNTALLSLNLKAGESLLKTIDLQQWKGQQTQIELHCISQSPLTTALIPLSGGKPTLELVETNPVSGLKVFKRPGALPMVRLTHKLECTSPGSSLEALERGLVTKDLSVTEECEGVYQLASGSSSEGSAKIIRRTGNTLTVQVAAANESMLFISQNYYPGWKAKVNGVQAKVHRLDYTFTGVVVPKGLSLIELRYRPMSFKLGLLVSLFGIITTLGLAKYFALGKITDQTQLFERNRPNI